MTNPVIVTINSSSGNPISRLRLIKIFSFFFSIYFFSFPLLWFLSIDSSKLISSTFTLQRTYPLLPNFIAHGVVEEMLFFVFSWAHNCVFVESHDDDDDDYPSTTTGQLYFDLSLAKSLVFFLEIAIKTTQANERWCGFCWFILLNFKRRICLYLLFSFTYIYSTPSVYFVKRFISRHWTFFCSRGPLISIFEQQPASQPAVSGLLCMEI